MRPDQWDLWESNDFWFENYKSFISQFLTTYKKIKNDENKSGWLIVDLEWNNLNAMNWCKYCRIKIIQSMRLLQTITSNVIDTPHLQLFRIYDWICRISNVVIAACDWKNTANTYLPANETFQHSPLCWLCLASGLYTGPATESWNRGFCNFFCKGAPI
jgi:hypothetical protein